MGIEEFKNLLGAGCRGICSEVDKCNVHPDCSKDPPDEVWNVRKILLAPYLIDGEISAVKEAVDDEGPTGTVPNSGYAHSKESGDRGREQRPPFE